MDDIGFGIHIISPIAPENSLINDKEITNIPSAVMLPLPEDSFQQDANTAEYANVRSRPDQDRSGNPSRGDFAGKSGPGAVEADDGEETQTSLLLEEAYTLSLSGRNPVPAFIEGEHQDWQLSSYDQFGRSMAKQVVQPDSVLEKVPVYGLNPLDTMSDAENQTARENGAENPAQNPGRAAADGAENGKRDSAEVSVSEDPPGSGVGRASSDGAKSMNTIPKTDRDPAAAAAVSESGMPETTEAAVAASAGETAALQGTPGKNRPDILPAKVEPNAAMRLLTEIPVDADKLPPQAAKEDFQTVLSRAFSAAEAKDAAVQDGPPAGTLQTGLAQKTLGNLQEAESAALTTALPSGKGSMENLGKIGELPYSLYLFGEVPPKLHEKTEKSVEPFVIHSGEKRSSFSQSDFLRLSDAIKMACVLHDLYWGGSGSFEQETPWYGPYIRYAIKNEIMKAEEFPDYNEFATRAEAAYLFSNSIPRSELRPINHIVSLPDVAVENRYANSIYLLYNAGVLAGTDGRGGFHPDGLMTRREAAVFAGRIATPSDRKHFRLD